MVEPIWCKVTQAIKSRLDRFLAGKVERVEQVGAFLVILDKNLLLSTRKIIVQIERLRRTEITEDHREVERGYFPQRIGKTACEAILADAGNQLTRGFHGDFHFTVSV